MLTGRPPFEGATGIDTMSAILQKDPVPAGRIAPGLPPRLDDLLAKCLEKDPADRYQHADEVAVDLRQILRLSESGAQGA